MNENELYDYDAPPVFTYSDLAENIIENVESTDGCISVLFKEFEKPISERSYALTYNDIVMDVETMYIVSTECGVGVTLYTSTDNPSDAIPVQMIDLKERQFIRISETSNNAVYEIKLEELPPWIDNIQDISLDAFPLAYTTESPKLVNGKMYHVSEVYAYFYGWYNKVLIDIITTPIKVNSDSLHSAKVNLAKEKISNTNTRHLDNGAIIKRVVSTPSGEHHRLYRIHNLGDYYIHCIDITEMNDMQNGVIKMRYKFIAEQDIEIIPNYETIFRHPSEDDDEYCPFLSTRYDAPIIDDMMHDRVRMEINAVIAAKDVIEHIDKDALHKLIQRKYDGHRIDKKRNKVVNNTKDAIRILKKVEGSLEYLGTYTDDDYKRIRIYNTSSHTLDMYWPNITFRRVVEELEYALRILGVEV